MKIASIVVRDKNSPFCGREFEEAVSLLQRSGYPPDKLYIVAREDEHEFAQTVVECKNFFDLIFVFSAESEAQAVAFKVCDLLKKPQTVFTVLPLEKKNFFYIPFGERGRQIVISDVLPYLQENSPMNTESSVFRMVGVPKETMEKVLNEAKQIGGGEFSFQVLEENGDIRAEILYSKQTAKTSVDEILRILATGWSDFIYSIDDTPLQQRVFEMLRLRGIRLSVAESFTGGGVAKRIIEVPGASGVLFESIVAYSNESKMCRLGVSGDTLVKYGAVSDETAYEMAVGLLSSGNCDVALATTGIAGPKSDDTQKPVGLNYIAAGTREAVYVYKYLFGGSREEITARAINQALFLLYRQIK